MAFISNFPILTNGKVEKIHQGARNSTWYSYIATNLQLSNILKLLTNVYLKGNEIWSVITDFLVKKGFRFMAANSDCYYSWPEVLIFFFISVDCGGKIIKSFQKCSREK